MTDRKEHLSRRTPPQPRVVTPAEFRHPWKPLRTKILARTRVFALRRDIIEEPNSGKPANYYVCECPDWVNVVATTPDEQLILVRQFRVATRRMSLEIPGGLIDPGEDPADAAARELREETGFAGDPPILIGEQEPNPAIQDNVTYTYLIENCEPRRERKLDAGEVLSVETIPVSAIDDYLAAGQIRHSLVVTGLTFYRLFLLRR